MSYGWQNAADGKHTSRKCSNIRNVLKSSPCFLRHVHATRTWPYRETATSCEAFIGAPSPLITTAPCRSTPHAAKTEETMKLKAFDGAWHLAVNQEIYWSCWKQKHVTPCRVVEFSISIKVSVREWQAETPKQMNREIPQLRFKQGYCAKSSLSPRSRPSRLSKR